MAVKLAKQGATVSSEGDLGLERFAAGQQYFRGLFSGGTLAYEAQHILADYFPKVYANAPIHKENKLANSWISQEHTIMDLGEDEFTVGRLHPMMDNEMRIRRLMEEAADPTVAVIMLDVVIGYGSHPDPACELAPAVEAAKAKAQEAGRYLEVVAVVTGTDEDPQSLEHQIEQLEAVGVKCDPSNEVIVRYAGRAPAGIECGPRRRPGVEAGGSLQPIDSPVAGINVGPGIVRR